MLMVNENTEEIEKAFLERERLDSLINSMTDGVLALDNKLKIVVYNGAALNILDVNGSVEGKQIDSVLKPIDEGKHPVIVSEIIQNSPTAFETRDFSLVYDDGSHSAIYLSISPVHTGYGKGGVEGYVLLLRDITHEKSLEEERSEFISVVSHELRTPVTIAEGSIGNAMYIVQKGAKPEVLMKALEAAHDQVLFLATMINDLSTLSRAERGKLTLEVETINMNTLLDELVASYKPAADAKHLEITLETSPRLETVQSSELYIREVLQNFVTNAIKYTETGTIHIEAHPVDNGVSVSVKDSGIGISKKDQKKIFEKFFRSEDYRTRKNTGTGLGLYVTMKLIKILKAELQVESELNEGSTFTVIFPNMEQPTA